MLYMYVYMYVCITPTALYNLKGGFVFAIIIIRDVEVVYKC